MDHIQGLLTLNLNDLYDEIWNFGTNAIDFDSSYSHVSFKIIANSDFIYIELIY